MSDLLVDAFDQLRIDDMSLPSDVLVTSTMRIMNKFLLLKCYKPIILKLSNLQFCSALVIFWECAILLTLYLLTCLQ